MTDKPKPANALVETRRDIEAMTTEFAKALPRQMPSERFVRTVNTAIQLNPEPIAEYLRSNVVLMKNMIAQGYQDARSLKRRIEKVEAWLANPNLLEADKDAEYAAVIEIDLADIKEPIVC